MKNFFKKLAFVLALAMVVTAIAPAGKASAATAPALKKSGKVLYIGGDKTGTIGDTYRFTFKNAAGYTATWKSTNKAVATVGAKTGTIQAVAVGTTSIKATLTNKAGKAVELTAKVWVKQNADKLGFGSQASVKEPLAVGDTAKVNVYRQVGTTKIWKQTDKSLSTDYIKWTSSDPAVATVSSWGTVTAVAAGKATITATAYQTEGTTVVDKASFEVTVQAGLTAAKQTGLSTIEANFAGDLSAVVTKDNVKVSSMVGTTKVNVVVKEVKFDATDKTKATITVYNTFVKDTEYVVEYAETTAKFVGADVSEKAVDHIAITTTAVEPNKATKVEVKIYDKNNIDITTTALLNRVDVVLAAASTDAFVDTTAKMITFYVKDKSATVKATYHTYDFTSKGDFTERLITAEGVIVSQENITTLAGVGTAVITNSGNPDYTNAKTNMSVKDSGYNIYIKTTDAKGNTITSKENTSFKFESSDKTTLMVSGSTLYPVKEGVAQIIVKFNDTVIGAVTVTIGAERKASTVTTTLDKTTLSKGSTAADTVVATVEVKDQYGDIFTGKTPEVSTLSVAGNVANLPLAVLGADNKYTLTFNGSDYSTEGLYNFKVKVDNQERPISFTVGDSKDAVSSYAFTQAGKVVDTAVKFYDNANSYTIADTKTAAKKFDMVLNSFATNGYKVRTEAVEISSGAAFTAAQNVNASTGTAIYVEVIDKDNNVVNLNTSGHKFITFASNKITVEPVVVSGTSIAKLANGTYTVRAYEVAVKNGNVSATNVTGAAITLKAQTSFTVTDTQVKGSVVTASATANYTRSNKVAALKDKDFAKVTLGSREVNSYVTDVTLAGSPTSVDATITKVTVTIPVNVVIGGIAVDTVLVQDIDTIAVVQFSGL